MSFNRMIRFIALEDDKIYYGEPILDNDEDDIGLLYHSKSIINVNPYSNSPLSPTFSLLSSVILTVKTLLSPLSFNEIKIIRGLGNQFPTLPLNQFISPNLPILFYKPITTLAGPEDFITIPEIARGCGNDYEVEVCVVLGKTIKDVSVDRALDAVLGYCSSNDVSSRALCAKGLQWGLGKSFDSWCPIGPVLVSPKALGDVQNLEMKTYVNGKLKQAGNTKDMVYKIAQLISIMSQGTTLEAGSIILSGSPPPLDRAKDPNPFLAHGDEVRCYVQGLGTLINHVVEENGPKLAAKL